jgi:hypothetical protein
MCCGALFCAASAGPSAPSMFDDDDEGALPDAGEEEDGAASDDDAFVVAKPQVRIFTVQCERGFYCCPS